MKELFQYLMTHKKFWLLPSMLTLIIISALIIATSGSALSTFIYTVF